jgi:hypothetical protein
MGILFSLFRNALSFNFSFEFSGIRGGSFIFINSILFKLNLFLTDFFLLELQDLLETLQNFFFEPSGVNFVFINFFFIN